MIRVAFTPVTQYDKACMSIKEKTEKAEGKLLGSEGSGTIEAVGPDVDSNLKGRKVAFCHNGWSQFCVQDVNRLLFFNDDIDLRLAATSVINPLTALSLKWIIREKGAKSCVFYGANSTLGRIFTQCARMKDIEVIGIAKGSDQCG